MCAYLALGQSYRLYEGLDFIELKRCESESSCYLIHHSLILLRVCLRILFKFSVFVSLEILYNSS